MPLGLIEVILVFGAVLIWSWIEYRRTDRLLRKTRDKKRQGEDKTKQQED